MDMMHPPWPSSCEYIWAKSPAPKERQGQSLLSHTWDVLCQVRQSRQQAPQLAQLAGFPALWRCLFWAGFFHDFGKAAVGFQASVRGKGPLWRHRHEVLSLAFLDWIPGGLSADEDLAITAAIISHHRDPAEINLLYGGVYAEEADDPVTQLVGELSPPAVEALADWFLKDLPAWISSLGFEADVALSAPYPRKEELLYCLAPEQAAQSMRRRLRAYRRLIRALDRGDASEWVLRGTILRGLMLQADHTGSAGLSPRQGLTISVQGLLGRWGWSKAGLYQHQRQAAETCGDAILSAPTGSGKTEAALLWAGRQAEDGAGQLFYTLPYQASMNAMYDRLQSSLPDQVGLLHGRSLLALYRRLMESDSVGPHAAALARAGRNLARLRHQPVQVLSPYQILRAAYQLKGYEAMLADFAGAAFVFDEVHAYEPSRLAMILEFISYLRQRFAARFFVMTATLPAVVMQRIHAALGDPRQISAKPMLYQRFQRHQVRLLAGDLLDEPNLQQIASVYQGGASVLVCCNTVARAQEAYAQLQALLPEGELVLVHGRFTARDRLAKERHIIEATGLDSELRRPVLVISTQVVEVSLNIDLDTIFTDPAPLEALLQRFGRVNRGRRMRLADAHVFTEPTDGQRIYLPELVQGALSVLAEIDEQPLDEGQVTGWLDAIYAGPVLQQWERKYHQAAQEFRHAVLRSLRPFSAQSGLEGAFERLFDGAEALPSSLADEYALCKEREPLAAAELLVPISWGQLQRLRRQGLVQGSSWPPVVDVPYSNERGLLL